VAGGGSTAAAASGGAAVAVETEKNINTRGDGDLLIQGDENDFQATCGSTRTY
jgi:hypothetical protein